MGDIYIYRIYLLLQLVMELNRPTFLVFFPPSTSHKPFTATAKPRRDDFGAPSSDNTETDKVCLQLDLERRSCTVIAGKY